jgi:LysM repeat protein/murein endopeptidase
MGLRLLARLAFAAGLAVLPKAALARGAIIHVVEPGETLWKISLRYGCAGTELAKANRLKGTLIKAGQKLRIPASCKKVDAKAEGQPEAGVDGGVATERAVDKAAEKPEAEPQKELADAASQDAGPKKQKPAPKPAGEVKVLVVAGDSLFKIAKRHNTTIADLKMRNGLASDRIRAGQTLIISPGSGGSGKVVFGQSVGRPNGGRLVGGILLPDDKGYVKRRPYYCYGTSSTVFQVLRSIAAVQRSYPKLHKLAIGDLSARKGGKIPRHVSHQSGRDIDLGFYFKQRPKGYPEEFVEATEKNINFDATWLLIKTLADSHGADGGVERIFLSYATQGMLYRMAKRKGVPQKVLSRLFQYPNGEYNATGIIRHEPGHTDHLHVRFRCLHGDAACLSGESARD